MYVSELLQKLDFGNQVAEFDKGSDRHFIITEAFRAVVQNRADIIAGDKGAGKTTIYKQLITQYTQYPELAKVEVVSGFNPSGSPIFSRLTRMEQLSESQYLNFWKTYILSLTGNWLLQLCEGSYARQTSRLNALLNQMGLRNEDDRAESIFAKLTTLTQNLLKARNVAVEFSVDPFGNPTITPTIELNDPNKRALAGANPMVEDVDLSMLIEALDENDITVWVLLDRLDEAFVGYPQFEVPILRALLRAYLDLLAYDRIGIKLFVRKDLFNKIVRDGFVNLTHVNARKVEIIWEKEDLMSMICRRIKGCTEFVRQMGIQTENDQKVFETVFPLHMEGGMRKSTTWDWMLAQIRDGNGVVAPRNLVELVILAKEEQSRREQRSPSIRKEGRPIIEPDSLIKALARLSVNRVQDTLLAESSRDVAALITGLRDTKREQTDESIGRIFGVDMTQAREFAATLIEIGLLESTGKKYKVAPLYRDGLKMHRVKE